MLFWHLHQHCTYLGSWQVCCSAQVRPHCPETLQPQTADHSLPLNTFPPSSGNLILTLYIFLHVLVTQTELRPDITRDLPTRQNSTPNHCTALLSFHFIPNFRHRCKIGDILLNDTQISGTERNADSMSHIVLLSIYLVIRVPSQAGSFGRLSFIS